MELPDQARKLTTLFFNHSLTASAMVDQRERALKAGMNDFLTKPFTPLQLEEKIKEMLHSAI
jgi:CheY-like chemotaxis protein